MPDKRKCTTSTDTSQDSVNIEENKTNDLNQKPVIKRNRYSFEDKQKILEDSKTLTSQELRKKYNVNSCLIRKWKSKNDDIKDAADKSRTKNMKKISTSTELDNLLFNWMCDCQRKGFPVSGPMLKNQALVISKEIGHSKDFHASNGWLEKWKIRMNIKSLKITDTLTKRNDVNNIESASKKLKSTCFNNSEKGNIQNPVDEMVDSVEENSAIYFSEGDKDIQNTEQSFSTCTTTSKIILCDDTINKDGEIMDFVKDDAANKTITSCVCHFISGCFCASRFCEQYSKEHNN